MITRLSKCNIDKQIIKKEVSVIDVLNYFGIKKYATGLYKCPVHDDKTASLNAKNNICYCHGCGVRLDSIGLYSILTGKGFSDSIEEMNQVFLNGKYSNINFDRKKIEAKKREIINKNNEREKKERAELELFKRLTSYVHDLESKIEKLRIDILPSKEQLRDLDCLDVHTEKHIETIEYIAKTKASIDFIKTSIDLYFDLNTEMTLSMPRLSKHINKFSKTRQGVIFNG